MAAYTLKIRRYDSESGEAAYWEEFDVELPPERSVLDGILQARNDQDGSIGIRCSCQAAICGSCGVRINGKSRLACNTKIGEAAEREYIVPAEAMIDVTQSMACIHCGVCVSACLSLEVDPDFIGPAALAKAYRFVGDPRDAQEEERLRDLAEDEHGIYDCTHCFACVEVCPKDVAPMNQIMRLRRRATADYGIKDSNAGYGHEKAFVNLIEKYGTLHESQLLPRSFGQGSLIRSQLDPSSLKQLIESFPTVINGLKSGKVKPKAALWHNKLPDQKQVRRIYNEVHSHGERIELNMYIVGESGGEDAGAMAEGSQEA